MTTIPQQIAQLQRELLTAKSLSRVRQLNKMIANLMKENAVKLKKEKKK